jgi:hypothetical protein
VWYRDAITNPGRELSLPLQHGLKHIFYSRSPHSLSCAWLVSMPIHQELDQFTQHALLALGP